MPEKYIREQFWKIYKKLPQELKDALFAEETGNAIYDVCKRNNILKKLDKIVDFVGKVLMGFLSPDEFQETLEKELKLKKEVAKKVSREINWSIFYPVRTELEKLYKIEIAPPAKMKITPPPEIPETKEVASPEKPEEKEKKPTIQDIYREPIE